MKKISKPTQFQQLLNKMHIGETYTHRPKYNFPRVKNQVFPKANYNMQCDLMELPTSKQGYKYLFCIVDLWSNYFDCEPLKDKSALSTLKAIKKIFKRKYLTIPYASLRTDGGSEFKGEFHQFLYDHGILHRTNLPDRHKQMGNIENLNRQIGRIVNTYMTNKTVELGKEYNEWPDILDDVRKELNAIKKHPKDVDINKYVPKPIHIENGAPRYAVGDLVYRRLEKPIDQFGKKLHSYFRVGDLRFELVPRKIVQQLVYTSKNPYRYILNDMPNVSYAEAELIPAHDKVEKHVVKKIIGKKTENKIMYYLVWWKGKKKDQSTWEPKTTLIEDGLDEYIRQYNIDKRQKDTKKRKKN